MDLDLTAGGRAGKRAVSLAKVKRVVFPALSQIFPGHGATLPTGGFFQPLSGIAIRALEFSVGRAGRWHEMLRVAAGADPGRAGGPSPQRREIRWVFWRGARTRSAQAVATFDGTALARRRCEGFAAAPRGLEWNVLALHEMLQVPALKGAILLASPPNAVHKVHGGGARSEEDSS